MLVREILETPGEGRVLVVDGEGSTWCALLGDMVAEIASDNGWSGIVINGGVRDVSELAQIENRRQGTLFLCRAAVEKKARDAKNTPLAFCRCPPFFRAIISTPMKTVF